MSFNHSMPTGLTAEEAQARLIQNGPNLIPSSEIKNLWSQILHALLDPMGLMLLGLSGLYFSIGDPTDATILLIAYVPIVSVDVILELRAQNALRALHQTLQVFSHVLRNGQIIKISSQDLVVGDILVLEEGQNLPADGKILRSEALTVSEAALTGESLPIEKSFDSDFYKGTTILSGRGLGEIKAIGLQTRFGKIAHLLKVSESGKSPLKNKVDQLVVKILWVAGALSIILFLVEFYRNQNLLQSLIIALTFSMSAIPEEFPLVFTLYLSLGAWRLSKKGVLVKSLPSVETLGRVDVICTDKTGTLTEGTFILEEVKIFGSLSGESRVFWETALLACEPHIVDTMEIAILKKSQALFGDQILDYLKNWQLVTDYPFDPQDKYMSHIWSHSSSERSKMAMKGSVEGILKHCKVSSQDLILINQEIKNLASQGKRLLALAQKEGAFSHDRKANEESLEFLALLVFTDPLRSSTKEAISKCQKSGIEIKLMTGDHPLTAHAIADEVGIHHQHEEIYQGEQLMQMKTAERHLAYQKGAIFSRMQPDQKHELIQTLKNEGKIIAMTGDGINDAPALKLADIGISLGKNATDVAQAAAKMVLMTNDFQGLSEAILEGRKIFRNLQKSFSYLISFHLPIFLLALVPPMLGWGELLLPVHIVLLELIVHPISAFVFENDPTEDSEAIQSAQELLSTSAFVKSMLRGLIFSLCALIYYYLELKFKPIELARTQIFTAFIFANISFMIVDLKNYFNLRFLITTFILLGFCFLLIIEPLGVIKILHFNPISYNELLFSFVIGTSPFLINLFSFKFKKDNQII